MVRLSTTPGLFLETPRTINTISIQNAAREPFKSILSTAQQRLARRDLFFAVYRGQPRSRSTTSRFGSRTGSLR